LWSPQRWKNATRFEAPAQPVDLLWANMALHMSPDPQTLIQRWHSLVQTDGFLMFSCLGPDTLRELRAEQPGAALFLVIGADQARAFARWRAPEEVAALATICVAGRAPDAPDGPPETVLFPSAKQGSEPVPTSPRQPDPVPAYPIPGGRWIDLALPPLVVSATGIRQTLARGQSPEGLLDPAVARYIAQHHLYPPT
jgi:hypothetical protein